MEFSIDTNNVLLEQQNQVESGEYNVTECNFIFSSEYEGLTKKAVFTGEDGIAYLQTIVDNKCSIPSEILATSQVVQIGVYAYAVENEELILRYSPEPTDFFIHEGSYKEAQNSTPPTPSEIEQLQAQITTNANNIEELQECCGKYDSDIADLKAEQITQNEKIQTNADNIVEINQTLGAINTNIQELNSNISDIKEEQVTQNEDIQTNKNDILNIKGEQITQNQNIQANAQNISNETTNRQNADNNLQSQIDAITLSSDVIDVLGTYQDLQSYDTSHVKANDIIKILQDSTHEDAMSYYRWVITDNVGTWEYVGSEGPYYTISQTNTLLNEKADKSEIPDLTDYVKNTDYATSSKGGVVKVNSYWGTAVNENGVLTGDERIYSTYQNAPNELLIAKGTLENVITGKELINQTQLEESQAIQDTEIEALQNKVEELETDNENLRKALPQIKGEGTDITLQNTSENKFIELGLNGNTEQDNTLSPNLYNVNDVVLEQNVILIDNDYLSINIDNSSGTNTIYTQYFTNNLDLKPSTQYTIVVEILEVSGNGSLNIINKNGNQGQFTQSYSYNLSSLQNDQKIIFKATTLDSFENITRGLRTLAYFTAGQSGSIKFRISVLEDLTITESNFYYAKYGEELPPSPYFPSQIKNVTGNANVKIQNKNFLIPEQVVEDSNKPDKVYIENGYIHFITAGNPIVLKPKNIKQNTAYTYVLKCKSESATSNLIRFIAHYDDGTNAQLSNTTTTSTNEFTTVFTTNANKTLLYVKSAYTSSVHSDIIIDGSMILEGSYTAETIPDYVPHAEQNYPFTFAEGQRAMQGTTLEDDGIHNARAQYIFTGQEGWLSYTSSNTLIFRMRFLLNSVKLCNYFVAADDDGTIKQYTIKNRKSNYYNLEIVFSEMEDVTTFKNWLAEKYANGKPVIMEYEPTETPDVIPYNATQQAQRDNIKANAHSDDDITIISSESDELGFDMNVVAVADANKVIDNQNNEIDTIKSRLDLLEG